MKFYVVIPARYSSSRFPGKVLAKIGDKSMLEHVFFNASKSNAKEVYIATDSDIIYKKVKEFTDNIYMTSVDSKNGTERIAELAQNLNWAKNMLVINVQADMPELKADNINFLAEKSYNNNGLSTLYYPLRNKKLLCDENTVKILLKNSNVSFHRSIKNDDGLMIFKHIGIYAYFVKDLLIYKSLPESNNEKSLSLEQYRFLDNNFNISAYKAVSDPGASVDIIDNINDINNINS